MRAAYFEFMVNSFFYKKQALKKPFVANHMYFATVEL